MIASYYKRAYCTYSNIRLIWKEPLPKLIEIMSVYNTINRNIIVIEEAIASNNSPADNDTSLMITIHLLCALRVRQKETKVHVLLFRIHRVYVYARTETRNKKSSAEDTIAARFAFDESERTGDKRQESCLADRERELNTRSARIHPRLSLSLSLSRLVFYEPLRRCLRWLAFLLDSLRARSTGVYFSKFS